MISKADVKKWLKAARNGDVAKLEAQSDDKPELVNARGGDEGTALHEAAREGHNDAVQWLVARGAHIEAQNESYRRPLMEASSFGRLAAVKILLEVLANPMCRPDQNMKMT